MLRCRDFCRISRTKRKLKTSCYLFNSYNQNCQNVESYLRTNRFVDRHIGPDNNSIKLMLNTLNYESLDSLCDDVVPQNIHFKNTLQVGKSYSEPDIFIRGRNLSEKNEIWRSYIGMGYYNCHVPNPVLRNVFENPGWTTQYTPYQCEIAQGRLENLLNFQTMVTELTGLEMANASLLDEGTAAAEAVTVFQRKSNRHVIFLSDSLHPQTVSVVKSRAKTLGLDIVQGNVQHENFSKNEYAGILIQYPDTNGEIIDYGDIIKRAHQSGALVACATDLLALCLIKPPGEMDVDIAVGSSQRFGVPLGYGGPHAAFFSCKKSLMRLMPGRIVGVTKDAAGGKAFRLTLQTREQHIKKDKATSNVCTAQALLANMAAFFAIYHGPEGLKNIAKRVHVFTQALNQALQESQNVVQTKTFFDTLKVAPKISIAQFKNRADSFKINFRYFEDASIGVSLDETVNTSDLQDILKVFDSTISVDSLFQRLDLKKSLFNSVFTRNKSFLEQPVFNSYHSETKLIRYMKTLENRDVSLVHSMCSLGSCTMKLNGTTEMMLCSLPGFLNIHPFVPSNQALGYSELINQLEQDLCAITGYDHISFQPNSGAQGEYAGLYAIQLYHSARGEKNRKLCLIPVSAHGTNPASAKMAGMDIEFIKVSSDGTINIDDLKMKVEKNNDRLSCLMITYPSTNGIFEETIVDICNLIHENGGQVYLDGANMNAQVGLCRPGDYGSDVSHLNLHKTFCIPHGGGGPGVGPVAVKSHLAPYLPGHPLDKQNPLLRPVISAAPYGSAAILPIPWSYIKLMGPEGLKKASQVAILNANYLCKQLESHYKVLHRGRCGLVAHEFILDVREMKNTANIEVADIAKRLMDYGFHAPTISWPVPGTMMIEPTESEDKIELDRFCESLISIREEIAEIESGKADKVNNVLKNAPHSENQVVCSEWKWQYSREKAAFPLPFVNIRGKMWPSVARADDAYGDRNIMCTCPPIQ